MPKGLEAFISLPVISEHLTVPPDQTPSCAACSETPGVTAASLGWRRDPCVV